MDRHLQPPTGLIDGSCHLYPVRVHFEDTDLSGIAYHANYLKWAERARSDCLRLLGLDQRAVFEAGEGVFAVAEAHVKYRSPARFEDVLTVESRPGELRAASARMIQHIRRGDTMLAEILVTAAFLSPEGRPRRMPADWRDAFARFIEKDNQ